MSGARPLFSPRVLIGVVAAGAVGFLLFLYALGAGLTGGDQTMGSGHANSRGLNGYAALVSLLERQGFEVSVSRNPGRLDEEALLVLTPPHYVEPKDLDALIEKRRLQGPTLLILPKWFGIEPSYAGIKDAKKGWVVLLDAESPDWTEKLELGQLKAELGARGEWGADGRTGKLPKPKQVQSILGSGMAALVRDDQGGALAAYRDDGGYYQGLAEYGQNALASPAEDSPESSYWPLVIVAEPDLMNNSGMADAERALLAVDLVNAAIDGYDLAVVFDLTLPGLGQSRNLLSLAIEPPFLSATLILILAALVIGWRGFIRFGAPTAEAPGLTGGKAQLARDGAMLVERARRMRLVGPRYAALVISRISRALGLSERADEATRHDAIARALERQGQDPTAFTRAATTLRQAKKPAELLRAAQALGTIERTLSR